MTAAIFSRPLFWVIVVVAIAATVVALLATRPRAEASALTRVSVQQLHAGADSGALVLDVREPFEFEAGRVPGARSVPLATFGDRIDYFPKDEPVYVVCNTENRSLVAAMALVEAGYVDVRHVAGGMVSWVAAGLPVER